MAMAMFGQPKKVVATNVVAADGSGDFVSIQDAIDALPAGGGVVYVKEGTYTISAAIEIYKSNVALFGAGAATLITQANDADDNMIELGDGSSAYKNIEVADLKLDGNSANQTPSKYGVFVTATSTDCRVQRCWVDDVKGEGVYVAATADGNIVTENTASNNTNDGMQIAGSTKGNLVTNNVCYDNTRNGIWAGSGNNTIEGNNCYGNGPSGASLGSGIHLEFSGNLVTGNLCTDNYYAGITVWTATEKNVVTGNFCHANRGTGISVFGDHNTLVGNSCILNEYHGMYVTSDYNTVTGNTCTNNSKKSGAGNTYDGLLLDGVNYTTVIGNQCNDDQGTPTQKYGIITAGTSTYNTFLGNTAQGNVTAETLISGTGTIEAYTNAEPPSTDFQVMHSDTGTTASTTETELDSYTATAGDFTANDEILVSMYFIPDTITHDHEDIIRIGAATDFTIHSYAASNAGVFAEATLGDSLQTSNFLSLCLVKTEAATHTTATSRAVNGGAVITGAWTISIRGKVQATGTLNYRWTIWRRRG